MKYLITLLFTSFLLVNSFSQQVTDTIEVSIDMNAYLIFEKNSNIKYNFASPQIKADLSGNKITIQGLEEDFYTTNMLVEVDNQLYLYIVKYNKNPKKFIFNYSSSVSNVGRRRIDPSKLTNRVPVKENKVQALFIDSSQIKKEIEDKKYQDSVNDLYQGYAETIIFYDQEIKSVGIDKYDLKAIVTNINVVSDLMLIKLTVKNESGINYSLANMEIVVSEKQRRTKKNTTQDVPCKILYRTNQGVEIIKAGDQIDIVCVINKVTISKKKQLKIRMVESNIGRRGDRSFDIRIPYQYITRAKPLI